MFSFPLEESGKKRVIRHKMPGLNIELGIFELGQPSIELFL